MTNLRDEQRLKVNVVKLDPHDHPGKLVSRLDIPVILFYCICNTILFFTYMYTQDNYHRPEAYDQLKNIGYRGVVKDFFTCPDAVKAYLCKHFRLHQTPVFSKKADAHIDRIIKDFGIRVFFVESTRFEVRGSRYNQGHSSTNSNRINAKGWLQHSVDKNKLRQINSKLGQMERTKADLETKV